MYKNKNDMGSIASQRGHTRLQKYQRALKTKIFVNHNAACITGQKCNMFSETYISTYVA